MRALTDHGDLNMRLTYAVGFLLQVGNDDVPPGMLAEFERVRDPLIGEPMVVRGEMLPRSFDLVEAKAAAQDIVGLLAAGLLRHGRGPARGRDGRHEVGDAPASGRLRVRTAFYVGLFIGVFGGGRIYTGSLFPTGADLLGLYLGTTATPLVWGTTLALIAWLTTLVWP